jgi:hypothetical protein
VSCVTISTSRCWFIRKSYPYTFQARVGFFYIQGNYITVQAFVARVQDHTRHFDPQDIEADITAAALEVEELRHTHRGSD